MPYVILNGEVLSEECARIPIDDRGFLYGDSVHSVLRCYNGKPFRLEAHLRRLNDSLRSPLLAFPCRLEAEPLRKQIRTLIDYNRCPEAVARLTVTRGRDGVGAEDEEPMVLLQVVQAKPDPRLRLNGAKLTICSVRRDAHGVLGRHKLGNHVDAAIGRREATAVGCTDAVVTDVNDNLLGCTAANLFAVVEGALLTPDLHQNVYDGVGREVTLECARRLDVPVREELMPPDSVRAAEEMFITSARLEIVPVAGLGWRTFKPMPGPLTARLMDAYRAVVENETA